MCGVSQVRTSRTNVVVWVVRCVHIPESALRRLGTNSTFRKLRAQATSPKIARVACVCVSETTRFET